MGIFSRTPKAPSGHVKVAAKSYAFPSESEATSFIQSYGSNTKANALLDFARLNQNAGLRGGTLVRSSHARELCTYNYLEQILDEDRHYLAVRDPTAKMILERPARDCWSRLPYFNNTTIDAFLTKQTALGLNRAAMAGHKTQARDGGALLYLVASGNPASPLRPGDTPLRWLHIPAHLVIGDVEDPNGPILTSPSERDPLLSHGIQSIKFWASDKAKIGNEDPIEVHGSRIIPMNQDVETDWWLGASELDSIHDDLWNLRDIIFSRTKAHFQGDPIIVDVDLSAEAQDIVQWAHKSEDDLADIAEEVEAGIKAYDSGSNSSFAPILGFKLRRMGAANLPDPKEDVMMLSSRISHGTPFPVKMILASTKGSSDVEDQDILTYAANIQRIMDMMVYGVLARVLNMGKRMAAIPARIAIPGTQELSWPQVRPLSPRDQAFVSKTNISNAKAAFELGRQVPPEVERQFPKDPSAQTPLPIFALKGKNEDGKSADPPAQPAAAPPSAEKVARTIEETIERELSEFRDNLDQE